MSPATPSLRSFAAHLIAQDVKLKNASRSSPATPFSVIEKLRPPLMNLMGSTGFNALMSRSLVLATTEIPSLRDIGLNAEGMWEGLAALEVQLDADRFLEARIVVLAHVLGLLVAFVGEALTLRLLSDIWPNLPPTITSDLPSNRQNFLKRDRHEKNN